MIRNSLFLVLGLGAAAGLGLATAHLVQAGGCCSSCSDAVALPLPAAPASTPAPVAAVELEACEPVAEAAERSATPTRASAEAPPEQAALRGATGPGATDLVVTDFASPEVLERKRAIVLAMQEKLAAQKFAGAQQSQGKPVTATELARMKAALLAKEKRAAAVSTVAPVQPNVKLLPVAPVK